MQTAVPRHDQIMREAIEANGGAVFKHTGDGLCAAFDNPTNAVLAAVAAQIGLANETWPDELDGPLRARIGVHTGTAREQNGDYLGPALNRCARLMGVGHGGQILISLATERLARDSLPADITLRDLGPHRLRDLATPEHVFQVGRSDLPAEFPALRSVESMPGNLPLQLTTFVGRDDQLSDLAKALEQHRLVTLTGVGGVGKTRFALQVAAEILPRFDDGAWLVELAPIGDPDAVPHAVGRVLGAQEVPDRSMTDTIVDVLRPRNVLLILDNCEHLLSAAGDLTQRIALACPHATIIATSREPLAVEGERVWPVSSLTVPARDDEADPDEIFSIPAVSLFYDRALAAKPDFTITPENATAIAEICRRLDGVPLAIELAAARVRSIAPNEIAARLDERFRLLRGGRRTAMERHQTLRATVEWSYGLLSEDERVMFDRLSVFAGGFILEGAEQVCAGEPIDEFDVADLVASLAEKSMLVAEDQPDGFTRFTSLETLRQFGEERLQQREEANDVGSKHAKYYAELAARSYEGLRGRDEARWVHVIEQEFDNIRAAHAWAMANEDLDIALGLPFDLIPFASWRIRAEIFGWADAAIALPTAETSTRYPEACIASAWESGMRGELDRAEDLAKRAIAKLTESGRRDLLPAAYIAGSARAWAEGDREAIERITEAVRLGTEFGDVHAAGFAMVGLGMLASYRGEHDDAKRFVKEGCAILEPVGNPAMRAFARYGTGEALQDIEPDIAASNLRDAIDIAATVNARFISGVALVTLASLRARHGDVREALGLLDEAITEWRRRGNWRQMWVTLRNVVELFERIELSVPAAVLYGASVEARGESETGWGAQGERLSALRERLKVKLGPEKYDEAVARGRSMPDEQIVIFTLEEIRREAALRG